MLSEYPLVLGLIAFGLLFFLLAVGVRVAIALAMAGSIGLFIFHGHAGLISLVPFRTLDSFVLTAIPLFILMGEILVASGVAELAYNGLSRLMKPIPGGLLHTNVGASAIFAAISGSSPATVATIGTVALPSLKKHGYNTRIALGTLAASGTLGILIPPSINLIIYGVLANESIGKLFAAGLFPGLVIILLYMLYIGIMATVKPHLAPRTEKLTFVDVVSGFKDLWFFVLLMVLVLGGIFTGFMTPTEAAAIGCFVALCLTIFLRKMTWYLLKTAVSNATKTTSVVLFIVLGATIFSSFLARSGVPVEAAGYVADAGLPNWLIITIIYFVYLVLGCFIDPLSIIVMTAATVLPLVEQSGFNLTWFGITYVITAEMGMITPPMGLNLFVIQRISKQDFWDILLGVFPFFLIMVFSLILFTVFPSIVMWVPNLLY